MIGADAVQGAEGAEGAGWRCSIAVRSAPNRCAASKLQYSGVRGLGTNSLYL